MRFLLSLSSLRLSLLAITHVLSEDVNDGNLFSDSDSRSLFPENPTLLSSNIGDSTLKTVSLLDDPNSVGLDWADPIDWNDPVELAGSGDLCTGAEQVQYTGRMRARRDANSCPSPGQTTNLLQLPGLSDLVNIVNGPTKKTKTEPAAPLPIIPESPPDEDNTCVPPYPLHLCCLYPDFDSAAKTLGIVIYAVVRKCRPST